MMTFNQEQPQPTPGRIVWYQTDGRGGLSYYLPAMVVRTNESTDPKGPLPQLAEGCYDLHVFSVDGESYGEPAVPFDADGAERTWRWPERA